MRKYYITYARFSNICGTVIESTLIPYINNIVTLSDLDKIKEDILNDSFIGDDQITKNITIISWHELYDDTM